MLLCSLVPVSSSASLSVALALVVTPALNAALFICSFASFLFSPLLSFALLCSPLLASPLVLLAFELLLPVGSPKTVASDPLRIAPLPLLLSKTQKSIAPLLCFCFYFAFKNTRRFSTRPVIRAELTFLQRRSNCFLFFSFSFFFFCSSSLTRSFTAAFASVSTSLSQRTHPSSIYFRIGHSLFRFQVISKMAFIVNAYNDLMATGGKYPFELNSASISLANVFDRHIHFARIDFITKTRASKIGP